MQPLGYLRPLSPASEAYGISRDGSSVVGYSQSGTEEAFVWREGTGMQPLAPLAPGADSSANAVNADGSVIAGASGSFAARWTSAGVESLGTLPGALFSHAYAISDDGNVVGGSTSGGPLPQTAMVWTPGTGAVGLADYLGSFGLTVTPGWRTKDVFAISGDGRTFAGDAVSDSGVIEGFVATVPAPAGAVLVLAPAILFPRRRCACR